MTWAAGTDTPVRSYSARDSSHREAKSVWTRRYSTALRHRDFDEVSERLAGSQRRIEAGAQLGFDTDLRNDGVFHGSIVVQTHYDCKPAKRPKGPQISSAASSSLLR